MIRNSNHEASGLQLDVPLVVLRLQERFPSIRFEEEYFQSQIDRIEALKEKQDIGNALEIAKRDAEERGPGYRFIIPTESNKQMKGAVTRHSLSFEFESDFPQEGQQSAEEFLRSFELLFSRDE